MAEAEQERGERDRPRHPHHATEGTSPLEWLIAAVSSLVVLATIAFLIHEKIDDAGLPPLIEIVTDTIIEFSGGYIVELSIGNSGNATAAQVGIEGSLHLGDSTIETSSATIDYIPAKSRRRAALIFTHDPRRSELRLRPIGYAYP